MDKDTKYRLSYLCRGARARCYNSNHPKYKNYGGRGIKVCERWLGVDGVKNFTLDMGLAYKRGLSLDRIDVNGDYSPENCRWVTQKVQQNNRRDNHLITYEGQTKTMAEWATVVGIKYRTLAARINDHKWPIDRALTERINFG